MDDDEQINICSEIWDDLGAESCQISFKTPIASGFRFRYQSEIDKKSYSLLKAEKNISPVLEVSTTIEMSILKIELVTQDRSPHFNTLYEVVKEKHQPNVTDGVFYLSLNAVGLHHIKLDSLGIRKIKIKEALVRIRALYPQMNDNMAKAFFNKHKEIVCLKATLYQLEKETAVFVSAPIKSQTSRENKSIKIKHFSPKVVAETGEQLIVVLEKKITTEDFEANIIVDKKSYKLSLVGQDGQTFVFNIPKVNCGTTILGNFLMKCGDSKDTKPIRFMPIATEQRKRKIFEQISSNLPLKRSSNYENRENITQQLYPETGSYDEIQTDGAPSMDIGEAMAYLQPALAIAQDNDSSKDSGIHSEDKLSDTNSNDDIEDDENEDSDESLEFDGFRRKHNYQIESLGTIDVPDKRRLNDSRLDVNISNVATKKILSEVARIGHDYAFGKDANDLFERMEKQLPVVFTLQDDVGDTPLNNAILKGNVKHAYRILEIVQKNCDWALDLVNTSGHSALILAPACDSPKELIEKLLIAGCHLDLWDDTGKSAVIYAIEYHNKIALEVLLKHAQKHNIRSVLMRHGSNYYTPLQVAVMNGFKAGIEMLLELKDSRGNYLVDVNEVGLMNEETALHVAVSRDCDIDIIEMILRRPDTNINQELNDKTTALHIATKMKSLPIISLLKNHNALDLPYSSEFEESDEEFDEDMEDLETVNACEMDHSLEEKSPVVEMSTSEQEQHPHGEQASTTGVQLLTKRMGELSLKGDLKNKLIYILISSDGPSLTVAELGRIVKPTYRSLFTKYGNTNEHRRDICEMLMRLECLPNSVGQLIGELDLIGRCDLISKIEASFGSVLINGGRN